MNDNAKMDVDRLVAEFESATEQWSPEVLDLKDWNAASNKKHLKTVLVMLINDRVLHKRVLNCQRMILSVAEVSWREDKLETLEALKARWLL